MATNLTVAYLGPRGTYSHQVAESCFGPSAEYIPKYSISDVFASISPSIPIGVVPQENSTFGSVAETYDQLRREEAGEQWNVVGEIMLAIQHCLFVRKGVRLDEIREVLSHEQALGQCGQFLSAHMPAAVRVKTASTSGAVKTISEGGDKYRYSAAIGPKVCGSLFPGVELLRQSIQDENENFTRFFVIARTDEDLPPIGPPSPARALLRIMSPPSLPTPPCVDSSDERVSHLLSRPNQNHIMQLLSAIPPSWISRIDRRPSRYGTAPFHDVYFIMIEKAEGEPPRDNTEKTEWKSCVDAIVRKVSSMGGEVMVLGCW